MPAVTPVFALFAATVLLVLGTGLQSVLVPVRAHLNGFTDLSIGILGGAYYLGFVAGCLGVPRLVRRVGHTRSFAVLAVVAAQAFPLHAVLSEFPAWLSLRAGAGFCLAGLFMIIESWLNEMASNAHRGRQMSIYLTLTAGGSACGQMLLGASDPASLPPFLAACLCISLSVVPLMVSLAPTPQPPAGVRLDIRKLYRTSPVGLFGCLFFGLANGAFWALGPLFVQQRGGSAGHVALFMGAAVLGGACAQWPVGRWSDRVDRRRLMMVACGGAVAAALPLALAPALSWPAQVALAAAFGASSFPLYALCVAHANDHAAGGDFVETSGGLLLTFGIGAAIGPLLATPSFPLAAGGGLFLFATAVHLGLLAFIAYRICRRAPAARGSLVPPRADGLAELDPSSPRWAAQ